MDSVAEIKMRLPIEQLVGQYCQLTKKGRNFVCICPFHNDTKPSLLVSPDKGIAYCFACSSGGDVFSFYQKIEGVDFPQALRELAEKAGVRIEEHAPTGPKKDDKERARDCLNKALRFYREQLAHSPATLAYLTKRGVTPEQIEQWEIGLAPDSFSATYDYLLKHDCSRKDMIASGLTVQRELSEERVYDRFRNRVMFPIRDAQGNLVGFGGRTLGADDAKYINSSDGILFHKSTVLYGLHAAKEGIRERGATLLVEGYFDVLACHRAGGTNAVATCGTALTEQHMKLLKRYGDRVTLGMDSDRAGQEAMERAFTMLAREDLHVEAVAFAGKDPSQMLESDPAGLTSLLAAPALPYLDLVLRSLKPEDLAEGLPRKTALRRVLALMRALPSAVERRDYLAKAAMLFETDERSLESDLAASVDAPVPSRVPVESAVTNSASDLFSSVEITLGMFLCYPHLKHLLSELIEPEEPFVAALYKAIRDAEEVSVEKLTLTSEQRERASVLALFCEQHDFQNWSETLAIRELKKHCRRSNREILHTKQDQISKSMLAAHREGKMLEEVQLQNQYQQILKMMKTVS